MFSQASSFHPTELQVSYTPTTFASLGWVYWRWQSISGGIRQLCWAAELSPAFLLITVGPTYCWLFDVCLHNALVCISGAWWRLSASTEHTVVTMQDCLFFFLSIKKVICRAISLLHPKLGCHIPVLGGETALNFHLFHITSLSCLFLSWSVFQILFLTIMQRRTRAPWNCDH